MDEIQYYPMRRTIEHRGVKYDVNAILFRRAKFNTAGTLIGCTRWQFGKFSTVEVKPDPGDSLADLLTEMEVRANE